ncbi:hypothetical protein MRX96_010440 [Rhipicephalus microplus]
MDLQLLLVQIHAGITVLDQVLELSEQDLFAQLDKLLVPRVRTCQGLAKEKKQKSKRSWIERSFLLPLPVQPIHKTTAPPCKSSRRVPQPHLIDDELNEAFQRGCVFDQQATNDWACCPVVDRQCSCARWSAVRLAPCVLFPGRMTGA